MNFGKRLRALRTEAGMTQERLARLADVSNATVFKLETVEGQDPAWSTVCKLADALGISVADFRDGDGPTPDTKRPSSPPKGKGKKGGAK